MLAIMKTEPKPGIVLREIDVPKIKDDEVLVKVHATGICGSDLHFCDWTVGSEWLAAYLPTVLGHEFSGTIVKLGKSVAKSWEGKRIICRPGKPCYKCEYCTSGLDNLCVNKRAIGLHHYGAFAEYVAVPVNNCYELGDDIDLNVAALSEPFAVALHAMELTQLIAGDTVVISGPGTIGLMLVYLAKKSGASQIILTGTSRDRKRLELGERLGANIIIDIGETDPVKKVMEITNGFGVDHVLEGSGNVTGLSSGIQMVKKSGTVSMVGVFSKLAQIDFTPVVRQQKRLIGSYGSCISTWKRVAAMLPEACKELEPMISHCISLKDGLQAFELARDPKTVKVLVKPE